MNPEAVALCQEHGIELVAGQCPYMFLPGTPVFHGWHRFFRKLAGGYPKDAPKAGAAR